MSAQNIQELIDFTTYHLRPLYQPTGDYAVTYTDGDSSRYLVTYAAGAVEHCRAVTEMSNLRPVKYTVLTLDGRVLYDNYFTRPPQGRYRAR